MRVRLMVLSILAGNDRLNPIHDLQLPKLLVNQIPCSAAGDRHLKLAAVSLSEVYHMRNTPEQIDRLDKMLFLLPQSSLKVKLFTMGFG